MDKLLVLRAGPPGRLDGVLAAALAGLPREDCQVKDDLPPALSGRILLFSISLGPTGLDEDFCRLLRWIRSHPHCLEGSAAGVVIDGPGELYTKQAAHLLVFSANGAGCAFPGRPLVEATGSLHNLDIQCRRRGQDHETVYRALVRDLAEGLLAFAPPRTARPRILMLHASDRRTSNTLALGSRLQALLADRFDWEELSLRNGAVHDCRGCSYTVCAHYAQQNSCFYGGAIVEDVQPALLRCNALLLLCPNYNDSVSANIMAFINRLTGLQLIHPLHGKYLYAVVVSGYSGSDLVAQQVLGALCLNKAFLLPPRFCLLETANDPGAALALPGIEQRLENFARSMADTLLPRP